MLTRITLATLLAAGLLVVGCGDDDDETTTTDPTTAEAGATGATGASGESGQAAGGGILPDDFAIQANAVCVEGNESLEAEVAEAFGGGGEPTEAEQVSFVTEVFAPSVQGQIDDIRDLGDPGEGADELSTFLSDAQSALDEIEDDPAAFFQQDDGEDPFADVEQQAKELGLPDCAS